MNSTISYLSPEQMFYEVYSTLVKEADDASPIAASAPPLAIFPEYAASLSSPGFGEGTIWVCETGDLASNVFVEVGQDTSGCMFAARVNGVPVVNREMQGAVFRDIRTLVHALLLVLGIIVF